MTLFADDAVNKGRQLELDFARGLAVLFMVLIHVQEYFLLSTESETLPAMLIDFLGGIPAAPVFMFLLGIGIVYTRKNDPTTFIKRGFTLLAVGYLLNFLRGFLPNACNATVLQSAYFWQVGLGALIYVDILQFSGLAMILFGLIKKYKPTLPIIALIALVFAGLNFALSAFETDSFLISAVTGLFWGSNELSFFPFLTWIFYPLTGYIFGSYLVRCIRKDLFFALVLVFSGLALALTIYLTSQVFFIDTGLNDAQAYYHHQIAGNIIATLFVLLWLSILHFIIKVIPKRLTVPVSRWSQNVTEIYFIHWVLIGWIGAVMVEYRISLPYYFILVILIFVISDYLAAYYDLQKKARKEAVKKN